MMNFEVFPFSPLWIVIAILIMIVVYFLSRRSPVTPSMDQNSLRILQDQMMHLRKVLDDKLEQNHTHHRKQSEINAKISHQANENIASLTKKLSNLEHTNQEIKQIGTQLEWLESILKNPKRRGNLGEYFLKELLENVFQSDSYALQYNLWDLWIVDAALFIGGRTIPVDSKFPYDNYERLIQTDAPAETKVYAQKLKQDIKDKINETAKYIDESLGTTDFAFMLLPAEGLYYDIFIAKVGDISPQELTSYAFSKKVIICSPSGFYAYLQTVIQWLKYLKIEEDVREVIQYVNKLEKDLGKYQDVFGKLGNTLQTANNHYDAAAKRLEIIDTDIYKIHQLEGGRK